MKKYCPLTKEIAFARLDKRLSDEDKKAILKARDMIEFHFSLGMWIRNTWIYGNEEERSHGDVVMGTGTWVWVPVFHGNFFAIFLMVS